MNSLLKKEFKRIKKAEDAAIARTRSIEGISALSNLAINSKLLAVQLEILKQLEILNSKIKEKV